MLNLDSVKIDQFLPSLGEYDAIASDVIKIREYLQEFGVASEIFTYEKSPNPLAKPLSKFVDWNNSNRIDINHFSIGTPLNAILNKRDSFKVVRYHNVTPPGYFNFPNSRFTQAQCVRGYYEMQSVLSECDYILSASQFNLSRLDHPETDQSVLSVLRDYSNLSNLIPNDELVKRIKSDEKINIIFVGRMIPHKCQHDLIFLLGCLNKIIPEKFRLFLVGGFDSFYKKNILHNVIRRQNLKALDVDARGKKDLSGFDVLFFSGVADQTLATLYHMSDLFVCMSEHEGFCVPLIEAMSFGLPIFAHSAAAVPETCGEVAYMFDKNNMEELIQAIIKFVNDPSFRRDLSVMSFESSAKFADDQQKKRFFASFEKIQNCFFSRSLNHCNSLSAPDMPLGGHLFSEH